MALLIRPATVSDAPQWLDLLKATLGDEYPDRQVYQLDWALSQFGPTSEFETWVADSNGRLLASIAFLPPRAENKNPIANLGRHLVRPESFTDGSAGGLLKKVNDLVIQRKQHCVARLSASEQAHQILFEKLGYVCTGFQPFKHMNGVRDSTLFYVRLARPDIAPRLPISESLPHIKQLAESVLAALKIPFPVTVRDGTIGYPLQTEMELVDASFSDFDRHRKQLASAKHSGEISGEFNLGFGLLRTIAKSPARAVIARRGQDVVAGLAYYFDPFDRCLRLTHAYATDDLSMGALFRHVLKLAHDTLSAVYVEVDILMTAPRLLKTSEQLGFVPIAYLPEFYFQGGTAIDVVKLVKLNMVYSPSQARFTDQARHVADIVDQNFQDQKVGVAIINLLRGLPIFDGLGDGELRKIARLFTQKLFLPGEKIFDKGDSGKEAYVIMRGEVNILLDDNSQAIATIGCGQIFGELAFLDGAPRAAMAIATTPTILLIVQRTAFNDLTLNEPHLGMVVMRNISLELTRRLRQTNATIMSMTK